jgi:V/A-type H+-transporting ATPase subunit E
MTAGQASPLEILRDEILGDARKQAERTIRRAERDGEAMLKKAREEAEQARRQRLDQGRRQADRKRELTLARVPVEVARMRAERLEEALQRIHAEARERLQARPADYGALVADLAAEAIGAMDGSEFVLELAEADRAALAASLPQEVRRRLGRDDLRIAVAETAAPIQGGVIVRDAPGRQVWNQSLEARLERLWPMIRRELGRQLERRPDADKES